MRVYLKKIISLITGSPTFTAAKGRVTERDLIRRESQIGAKLFGPLPKGHRREFFCLDEHTWVWYEEWPGADGKMLSTTTRYEIQPSSVIKIQDSHPYQAVEGKELENLSAAIRLYREHVIRGVYGRDHVTGQPLPRANIK